MKRARSADDSASAAAYFSGLPGSARMMSANVRSRSRRRAAARPSTSPRLGAGSRPHGSDARAAASTAQRTSSAPPRATWAMTASSIGERFSNVPPAPGVSRSAIQWLTRGGYMLRENGARDRSGVEAVMREDFGIGAAGGDVGQSDRGDLGAGARARQRRRDHDALPQRHVMVVERDHERKPAERRAHPVVVEAIQPGEIDDRR